MDGIINLKKDAGMTSHTAVARIRKIIGQKKVGHPGTLDPEATGVLPILLGSATKTSDYFLNIGKSYVAGVRFGIKTSTQDVWGETLETSSEKPSSFDEVAAALKGFEGNILQVPPMYSALKRDGVPLYKLARRGEEIDVEARPVEVYETKLLSFDGNTAKIYVHCGRGTYIRTIVNDLGDSLGCLAAMESLERTSYGRFNIENAVTLETFEKAFAEDPLTAEKTYVMGIETVFEGCPRVVLNKTNVSRYMQGKTIALPLKNLPDNGKDLCLYNDEGVLFATCDWKRREDGLAVLSHGRFFNNL